MKRMASGSVESIGEAGEVIHIADLLGKGMAKPSAESSNLMPISDPSLVAIRREKNKPFFLN